MSASATAVGTAPIDAVTERLNDPAVAASLVNLLDHVELLSTLVTGLNGFVERGDTIIESLAAGVAEVRGAQQPGAGVDVSGALDSAKTLMGGLNDSLPHLNRLFASGLINDELLAVLSLVADAAVEGSANARQKGTTVNGVFGALRSLKDPDVQHGLGLLVEVARSLGTRLRAR